MKSGERVVIDCTYSIWTAEFRTHGGVDYRPPDGAVVVDGVALAETIDNLNAEIASLKAENAKLRAGPQSTSTAANVTMTLATPDSGRRLTAIQIQLAGPSMGARKAMAVKQIRVATGLGIDVILGMIETLDDGLAMNFIVPIKDYAGFQYIMSKLGYDVALVADAPGVKQDSPFSVKAPT